MKKTSLTIIAVFCVTFVFSQKLKVTEGSFDFFVDLIEINVEFEYENQKLFKDNLTNEEYVKKRATDLEEDTRGKGKAWKKKWFASRELIYQPKFLELMNDYVHEREAIFFGEELEGTMYTLIVETVWLYPGWNAAVMRHPAELTTVLKFVETENRDNVLLVINSKKAPGNRYGGTFSNEDRIGEGYAKTGKSLAKLILKKAF